MPPGGGSKFRSPLWRSRILHFSSALCSFTDNEFVASVLFRVYSPGDGCTLEKELVDAGVPSYERSKEQTRDDFLKREK